MEKTNNFLNNQKFIFGKNENKKISMLYLGEKRYFLMLNFLTYFTTYFLGISFIIFLLLISFIEFDIRFFISCLIISFGIIYSLFSFNKNIKPILTFKNYFLLDINNIIFYIINLVLYIVFLFLFLLTPFIINNNLNISGKIFFPLYLIILLILFVFYNYIYKEISKNNKVLNLINIILFPVTFICGIFIYLFSYFNQSLNKICILKTLRNESNLYKNFYEITKK